MISISGSVNWRKKTRKNFFKYSLLRKFSHYMVFEFVWGELNIGMCHGNVLWELAVSSLSYTTAQMVYLVRF